MKRKIINTALITAALACAASASAFSFAGSSVLSTGNWVKIGVPESGLYEITYDQLRSMGFSSPESVAVYGSGGVQTSVNFYDTDGYYIAKDDLQAVGVMHRNNKLYFYGAGVADIAFQADNRWTAGGSFKRQSRNIYSDIGVYFLTDSRTDSPYMISAPKPPVEALGDVSFKKLGNGAGYAYHEVDLSHNNYGCGQLFWGESLKFGGDTGHSWDAVLPGIVVYDDPDVANATLEMVVYSESFSADSKPIVECGVLGATGNIQKDLVSPTGENYRSQSGLLFNLSVPAEYASPFINISNMGSDFSAGVDYWVLSYIRSFPNLSKSGLSQDRIFYRDMRDETYGALTIPDYKPGIVIFDVSYPGYPMVIDIDSSGEAIVTGHGSGVDMLVADLSQPQKTPLFSGRLTGQVENQNLHSLARAGADLLIVTIPELMDVAEQLAAFHRSHDGMKVIVADAMKIYNEYSGGVPDAMAYRTMARNIYDANGGKFFNILLFGPLAADFRGMQNPRDPASALIAYQNANSARSIHVNNINDYHGIMADVVNITSLHQNPVDLGVGVLPVNDKEEARNMIDKIKRYCDDPEMVWKVNETMTVGGLGDDHTHDNMAISLDKVIKSSDEGNGVGSVLIIDAFGQENAKNRFVNKLKAGKIVSGYYGHGSSLGFGGSPAGDFFTTSDLSLISSTPMSFMFFAGCDLSNFDRGARGLGESMVIEQPGGMIGTFIATRQSWSGQNQNLCEAFFKSLYKDGDTRRVNTPTIGEVSAAAKTKTLNNNSLTYQLLCDPAIRIPVALRDIEINNLSQLKVVGGSLLEVNGYVRGASGGVMSDFNGKVTLKIMAPEETHKVQELVTTGNTVSVSVTYADDLKSSAIDDVVNGKFTLNIFVPEDFSNYIGDYVPLYLAAYDPQKMLTASERAQIEVVAPTGNEKKDESAPEISGISYDFEAGLLSFTVSDNAAINPAVQGNLTVDTGNRTYTSADVECEALVETRSYFCKLYTNIPEGQAKIVVEATDNSGNKGRAETILAISAPSPSATVTLQEKLVNGKAQFEVVGNAGGTMTLIIVDADNNTVFSVVMNGNRYEWNGRDYNGVSVAPGLYRAYVISDSATGHTFTRSVDIPVY